MTCTDLRKDMDEKEAINTVVKSSTVGDFRKNDNSKNVPYILQPEVEPQIEESESRNQVPDSIKLSSGAQEPLKDIAEKIMVKNKKRVKPMKKKEEGPAEFDPRKFNAYGQITDKNFLKKFKPVEKEIQKGEEQPQKTMQK